MTKGAHAQRGAVGALVIAVMVIILLGVVATYVLSRIATGSDEAVTTQRRLATAAEALDAFAGASSRLPCPANPTLDDGLEVRNPPAACQYPEGTLPWRTIGLKREDAYDAWGRKISYRVYTGNRGSLVQDEGASMVYCDTTPAAGTGTEAGTGLCRGRPSVGGAAIDRNTSPTEFLDNKGFTLNDQGTAHASSVAYVLVSHGATGLGGYTVSGARLDLPLGDERNNTRDSGPFTIKAFSDVDTAATSGQHFDDLLAYRTVSDLVRRANLAARDWTPEAAGVPPPTVFNEENVRLAGGSSANIAGGGVGASSLTFAGATVTGIGSSSTPTELGFGDGGGGSGQGGLGVGTGSDFMIQSSANELLRIEFTEPFTKFAVTLNDFGVYGAGYFEIVELRFYSGGTQVGGSLFGFCNTASALSSFTFDVGADYDRVDIVPVDSFNIFDGSRGITAFLVSEIKACKASETTCRTALDDPANSFNTRCS